MTPFFAAGAINKKEICKIETLLRRNQLLLPNDIKSSAINAICENFVTPTAEVIEELAKKNRLFCPKMKRFESKKC